MLRSISRFPGACATLFISTFSFSAVQCMSGNPNEVMLMCTKGT